MRNLAIFLFYFFLILADFVHMYLTTADPPGTVLTLRTHLLIVRTKENERRCRYTDFFCFSIQCVEKLELNISWFFSTMYRL